MNRNISSRNTNKDAKTGKRKVDTVIVTAPDKQQTDFYIKITSLERLDILAYKFYDDVTAWPILAAANGIGKGTLFVQPGTILRIPTKVDFEKIIERVNGAR